MSVSSMSDSEGPQSETEDERDLRSSFKIRSSKSSARVDAVPPSLPLASLSIDPSDPCASSAPPASSTADDSASLRPPPRPPTPPAIKFNTMALMGSTLTRTRSSRSQNNLTLASATATDSRTVRDRSVSPLPLPLPSRIRSSNLLFHRDGRGGEGEEALEISGSDCDSISGFHDGEGPPAAATTLAPALPSSPPQPPQPSPSLSPPSPAEATVSFLSPVRSKTSPASFFISPPSPYPFPSEQQQRQLDELSEFEETSSRLQSHVCCSPPLSPRDPYIHSPPLWSPEQQPPPLMGFCPPNPPPQQEISPEPSASHPSRDPPLLPALTLAPPALPPHLDTISSALPSVLFQTTPPPPVAASSAPDIASAPSSTSERLPSSHPPPLAPPLSPPLTPVPAPPPHRSLFSLLLSPLFISLGLTSPSSPSPVSVRPPLPVVDPEEDLEANQEQPADPDSETETERDTAESSEALTKAIGLRSFFQLNVLLFQSALRTFRSFFPLFPRPRPSSSGYR
jgi:hypothetical protein